jgi:hypothetical protein
MGKNHVLFNGPGAFELFVSSPLTGKGTEDSPLGINGDVPGGGANIEAGYGITITDGEDNTKIINVTKEMPKETHYYTEGINIPFLFETTDGTPASEYVPPTIQHVTWTREPGLDRATINYLNDENSNRLMMCLTPPNEYSNNNVGWIAHIDSEDIDILGSQGFGWNDIQFINSMSTNLDGLFEEKFMNEDVKFVACLFAFTNDETISFDEATNNVVINGNADLIPSFKRWFAGNTAEMNICVSYSPDGYEVKATYPLCGYFEEMFEGCTRLISVPNFKLINLYDGSRVEGREKAAVLNRMFYGCISIDQWWEWDKILNSIELYHNDYVDLGYLDAYNSQDINPHTNMFYGTPSSITNNVPSDWGGTAQELPENHVLVTLNEGDFGTLSQYTPNVGSIGSYGAWWGGGQGWAIPYTDELDDKGEIVYRVIDLTNAWYDSVNDTGLIPYTEGHFYFEMDNLESIGGNNGVKINLDNAFRGCDGINSESQYGQFNEGSWWMNITSHTDTFTDAGNNYNVPSDWGGQGSV